MSPEILLYFVLAIPDDNDNQPFLWNPRCFTKTMAIRIGLFMFIWNLVCLLRGYFIYVRSSVIFISWRNRFSGPGTEYGMRLRRDSNNTV
jgi:uncharacterized membrane protein